MVTTRSQEKRINETPKSSTSQNGLSGSVDTPALLDNSPRYFTPATSKPARIAAEPAFLGESEKNGDEAALEGLASPAPQDGGRNSASGTRDQSKSGSFAGVHLPLKASSANDEKIPLTAGIQARSDINTELPQRPKAPELYFTPMTTSKRKRFDSEGLDDSILEPGTPREQPLEQPSRANSEVPEAHGDDPDDDDDDDDAPEVLSSKPAARQALSTPIPPSRNSTKKRKKTSFNNGRFSPPSTTMPPNQSTEGPIASSTELDTTVPKHDALEKENLPAPSTQPGDTPLVETHREHTDAVAVPNSTDSPSQVDDPHALIKTPSTVPRELWPVASKVVAPAAAGTVGPDALLSKSVVAAGPSGRHQLSSRRPTSASIVTRPGPQLSHPSLQTKPRVTSLQDYRARLLNRHPRTTKWGPRRAKFVDV